MLCSHLSCAAKKCHSPTRKIRDPLYTTFQKIFTIIRIFLKSEAPKALYSSHSFIVSALITRQNPIHLLLAPTSPNATGVLGPQILRFICGLGVSRSVTTAVPLS